MPKKPGNCRAIIPAYYYDTAYGDCMKFNYGGCKGNRNRFNTYDSCFSKCISKLESDDDGINDDDGKIHQGGGGSFSDHFMGPGKIKTNAHSDVEDGNDDDE